MIISIFDNKSGFFSMFFFFVNHYIYALKNNLNFEINNTNWLFKYNLGWEDYFENININYKENNQIINGQFNQILFNYSIQEYKNVLDHIYKYNKNTIELINQKKIELNLLNKEYASIFIRRGDKLLKESDYIHSSVYLKYLLELNPTFNIIYLQTDDYNCYLELEEFIKNNNLNITLITLCNKNCKGMIIFDFHKNSLVGGNFEKGNNIDYLKNNMSNYSIFKPINQMNNEEIYNHTLDMIIGIDMVLNSSLVITDYSSNVARFIKIKHKNSDCVYDIQSKTNYIDYNKIICPSYSF